VQLESVDQQIRELCTKAIDADGRDLHLILTELRLLLRIHTQKVRYLAQRSYYQLSSDDTTVRHT
jgi:hypothetical protein